jgi:hypothetical protein
MNRVWERLMLVLVVCVPVPALALSGLSVPLPSVVERVAASLVPFASSVTLDGESLAAGAIVHVPAREAVRAPATAGSTTPEVVGVARSTRAWQPKTRATYVPDGGSTPGPVTPRSEVPTEDAPKAPDPAPEAPAAPTAPPDSDEQPTGEGEKPTPPVEPDAKPKPKDDVDIVPTVDVDVKPPDATLEPDVKVLDVIPGSDNADERRNENAIDAVGDSGGKK